MGYEHLSTITQDSDPILLDDEAYAAWFGLALPRSLASLTLRVTDEFLQQQGFGTALHELSKCVRVRFPNLKRLQTV